MHKAKNIRNFTELISNCFRVITMAFRFMPWYSVGMIFLNIVIGITPIFAYKAMGSLIDSIILGVKNGLFEAIVAVLAIYVGLNFLPSIAATFERYLERIYYMRLQDHFDMTILKKRSEFDICQYEDTKFLDFMQRAFNQSYFPLVNLLDGAITLSGTIAGILVGSVAAFVIDWKVFMIVVLTALPTFVIEVKYGGKLWNLFAKNSPEQRRSQDLRRFFSAGNKYAVIDGKLYQVSKKFLKMVKKIMDDFTTEQIKTEDLKLIFSLLAVIVAGIGIFIGTGMVIKSAVAGFIAIGTVVYAFQTLTRVSGQVSVLLGSVAKLLERNLYVTDIFKVLDTSPALPRATRPIKLNLESAPAIKFENVSFRYPGQKNWALRNVSFELNPGEKLGLVGNNGSGKSTIVRLLLRVHDPVEGRVTINGVDLREVDFNEWWSSLGVLLQDFVTYNFSVKDSVAIGRTEKPVDLTVVKQAVNQSTLADFVNELPEKYENMIGVEFAGVEPSKGQRQKLAIARALYRSSYLLILDEPTASIDSESSSRIFQEIEALPVDRSAILISHNFATIKRASKIIVMEKGKIIEEGTHDDLVEKNGIYAKAYEEQKSQFE